MTGQEPDVGLASLSSSQLGPSSVHNDDDWFRWLFDDNYQKLIAYARRRTNDWSDADDVVSEVFATAWRRRDDRDTTAPALPWLYGIAANTIRNQRRASGRRLRLVDHLQAQPPKRGSADPAERSGSDLVAALSELSFDDQEVLRLVAWEGLTHVEVGQVLGCSTNAVGIRIHRARQRLQAHLHPTDTTDEETT